LKIKKYSVKKFYILLVFVIISIFLLINVTPGFKGDIEKSFKILLKQPTLFKTKLSTKNQNQLKIIDYPKKIYFALENFILTNQNYERLELNINFIELEKLKKDRKIALYNKKLINPKKVDVEIIYKKKKYDAKARLKGDLSEHWGNNKQWSLKIELKNDDTIFFMNEFAVSNFEERAFPYNFVISEIFEENNILYPQYKIVEMIVNGESWGLMLVEEQISESFYARNKLKEVPIIKMTNEEDFRIFVIGNNKNNNVKNTDDIARWQGKLESEVYNEKKILNKTNIPYLKTNQNILSILKNFQEIIRIDNKAANLSILKENLEVEHYAKLIAIMSVFGDDHSDNFTNSRYYLDPYTLNIFPVLTDSTPSRFDNINDLKNYLGNFNSLYKIFYNDLRFQKQYFDTINHLKKNINSIEKKFLDTCRPFGRNCADLVDIGSLKKNIEIILNNREIFNELVEIDINNFSKRLFNTKNQKNLINNKIYFRIFDNGMIHLYNLTSEFLKIKSINLYEDNNCINDCFIDQILVEKKLKPSSFEKISKLSFNFNNDKLDLQKFTFLEIEYLDENHEKFIQTGRVENHLFSRDVFFKKQQNNPDINFKISKNDYIIPTGKYFINKPIIIPSGYNLNINAGTELLMAPEAFIKIVNGNINFKGKKNKPIIIDVAQPGLYWKGLYVNAKNNINNQSFLKFVELSNFTYFNDNKIQLTGGINFLNNKVNLSNVKISNNFSEDAINLVNSEFSLQNVSFHNLKSDGIDVDFGVGEIQDISLKNIGGDAIDFSGSNVILKNILIENTGDKGISVGENSIIKVNDVQISNAKIAIATKDSSNVDVKKAKISNCKLYDFAVYKKKSYFSNSVMIVDDAISCNKPISQKKNELTVNGKKIKIKKINVKELYK
jgi:hypothetical protein